MQRSSFLSGCRRVAGALGVATLAVVGTLATSRADSVALFANDSIKITGSDNLFCGSAHCNGSIEVNGSRNGVSGNAEYVAGLKTNQQNDLTPVQTGIATMPQPPHDLAYYRLLARTNGTYFAGTGSVDGDAHGLVFAERDLRVSGSGLSGTVTLVAACGEVTLSGSHNALAPAVDGMLVYSAAGDASMSGSGNAYTGTIFARAGQFRRSGADDLLVSGPVIAGSIRWSGARGHVGGDCCTEASQCDDGNACTSDACTAGACTHGAIAGCVACTHDADCDAANACMQADCHQGVCVQRALPGCTPCTADADCNDGKGCTADACRDGVCTATTIAGCVACTTAADCRDGDPCTTDVCNGSGACVHQAQPCGGCRTAADCDDHDACTEDQCAADGSCQAREIPGCVTCTTDAGCDDANAHTTDTCTGGICTHHEIPVEVCDDGIDNDGNGRIDCADPACASFPACAPKKEICGNCIDDDGDGLVDSEDPDCCAQPFDLELQQIAIRPGARRQQDRLKLNAIYTRHYPPNFSPLTQDTSIQIADDHGQVFCTTVKAGHFMPRGQHGASFWGDGSFSNGLSDGRFTINPNGMVKFRTHGHQAQVRPTDSRSIRVTLRVGNHCSRTSITPRAKKTALLFP